MTINGEIIHKGERYGYGADCGNEYQNMYVGSVWDSDGDWLILGEPRLVNMECSILADAKERIPYLGGSDPIKSSETLDEYLGRMAKIWHPEELKHG